MAASEDAANASPSANGDSRGDGSWFVLELEVLTAGEMEKVNECGEESKDQKCRCEEVRCNIAK